MKKKIPLLLILLVLLAGGAVLLYPAASNWINTRNQTKAIQQYSDSVQQMDKADVAAEKQKALKYNEVLRSRYLTASSLGSIKPESEYDQMLNIGGVMGHVDIPSIGVHLPIYHGVEETVLKKGVGHMPQTALPIGGQGNHSVLSSHRAMATSDLFNDLDQLAEGDVFYLTVLDEILAYQVDQIIVVLPEDTAALMPVEGKDYVTLVTCTPYAINSHRLLVRGVRIPYESSNGGIPTHARTIHINWMLLIVIGFAVIWIILGIILWRTRRQDKQKPSPETKPRRKWKLLPILAVLLALTGSGVLGYPTVSRILYRNQAEEVIADFNLPNGRTTPENAELLRKIREYNRELYETGQTDRLQDPFAFEQPNADLAELGYDKDIIGYLSIEKMDLRLPVYLGASRDHMLQGAAHLTHTSIPVGGENTNAAIIGHRNLMRAEMFRDIQLLEPGDTVLFTNQWDTLTYRVTETAVITPEETEYLLIQPGRDLLTLVTCHPRGSSANRYIVYCERVK